MVYDVSGSVNRVDDYQPWPKEGDSANCTASEDREGCFDGLIAGHDVTNTALEDPADLSRSAEHARVRAGQRQLLHDARTTSRQGISSTTRWNEVLYFSSSGMRANYRNGVPELGQHLQHAGAFDSREHSAGPLHSGQVATRPQADGQCRPPSGHQLRMDAGALPGGDAVRRSAMLRQDVRYSRLESREPALLGRL